MTDQNKYQVMPPLSEEEYQALKADIKEKGLQVPLLVDGDDNIIDGHHRKRAIDELAAEGLTMDEVGRNFSGHLFWRAKADTDEEKRNLAWSLNMQRRHLSSSRKRELVDARLKETPSYSDRWLGEILGVDHKTVRSRRMMLELTGEIPQLERVVGKDGKERPRNVAGEAVDELRHREELELAKKKRYIRDALLGRPSKNEDDELEFMHYYGPKTDEALAKHFGVTPGIVTEEREDLEENGANMGDMFGSVHGAPPPLMEEAREKERKSRSEQAKHTKKMKDEGYKSKEDHKHVLGAIEGLAHALQMHKWQDKPKRVITPEEAVEAYTSPDIFKRSSLYYTEATTVDGAEQGRIGLEHAENFRRVLDAVMGTKTPPIDAKKELTSDQRQVLDDIDMYLKVANWLNRFGSLLSEKAQKDIEVARRALAEKDRIAQEVEEKAKEESGSVTPLAGRRKKKGA